MKQVRAYCIIKDAANNTSICVARKYMCRVQNETTNIATPRILHWIIFRVANAARGIDGVESDEIQSDTFNQMFHHTFAWEK